jgi:TnpA family transposase
VYTGLCAEEPDDERLVILDGLLEQHTSLRPTTLVTDSASYSDVVFGLFMLLGTLRFEPSTSATNS